MEKELTQRHVVTRKFGCNVDKVCENIPAFEKLRELYGIDTYHVLQRVGRKLPEWHTVSKTGNEKENAVLCKFHHILTLEEIASLNSN